MDDDLHTLSAAYALDALSREDRERFETHLVTCDRCRGELAGLEDASASLAFAVEGPPPPADLRARILDAVQREPVNVVPFRPRRSLLTPVAAAVAVAACAAAVGFGLWASSLHHSLSRSLLAVQVLGNPASRRIPVSGGKGQLVVDPSGTAVLAVRLASLPNGKTYEAWVADPTVQRAGQFDGGTTTLPVRVNRGARVMVTIEDAGGVAAPTSQPLFVVHA
jgi:anti-sigma factor RsiW